MAKTNIEIGFPRSFDLFEEYRDNYSRWTAATFQMISKPEAAGILEGTVFEIFGSPVLPDVLDRLIIEFLFQKDTSMEFGFYECEILLRHYEAGSRGQNNPDAWTEIEMFKAIRKASIEEWEALIISPAPELEAEPIIPPALLAMDPEELKAFVDHFNKKDPWKGPDYPKMNLSSISTGYEEGERCNRDGCLGIIEWLPEDPDSDCSCHIKPPCSRCTDVYLGCPVCDWDSREVEEVSAPITQEEQVVAQFLEETRKFNEIYTKAGIFSVNTFPDATPAIHLLKLIQEANEAIQAPEDVVEYADIAISFYAAVYRAGFSMVEIHQAGLAKIEEVKKLEWLKLEDGTYQSIKPAKLNPGEAIMAFTLWLTTRDVEVGAMHSTPAAIDLAQAFIKSQSLEQPSGNWTDKIIPFADGPKPFHCDTKGRPTPADIWKVGTVRKGELGQYILSGWEFGPFNGPAIDLPVAGPVLVAGHLLEDLTAISEKSSEYSMACPVGLTAVSSECGELDLHCRIDRIEIGPEGAEATDRRGNRAKVTVCGVDIGSTPWNPKPSRWQRFKAWLIKALAPLGGWGERMSDQ